MKKPLSLADLLRRKTTLYFFSNSGETAIAGRDLAIRRSDGENIAIPLAMIRRVVLIGKARIAPALLHRFLRLGIPGDWLDIFGHPLGQLLPDSGAYEAAMPAQAAFCASPGALALARALILAKVDNCHEILRRRTEIPDTWPERREAILAANSPESLRGAEGMAAKEYFGCWRGLLHKFSWQGREPKPAPDPVNMMLSSGYGLLRNRLASALRNTGLDSRLGVFHVARGSHCALASDLMEPLRACVDTEVLALIRRQELKPEDFQIRNGACACKDKDVFAKLYRAFEDMFSREHDFYMDPADNRVQWKRSLNDCLDDLAESFALHIHDREGCIIPRLAPCPAG